MTSREFVRWMVYFHLEPFGDEWQRTAILANLMANLWSSKKGKIEDWMPPARWKVQSEGDAEDTAAKADLFFRMLAGGSKKLKRQPAKKP